MDSVVQIPFVLNGFDGLVEVSYEVNRDAVKPGFELFRRLGFDADRCIGYPSMHAFVKRFGGTGYSRACAWIQIITDRFHNQDAGKTPLVISQVDVSEHMMELGVPFFAYGYPAEIFDAPCDNLGGYARLEWVADTFLVTQPTRINDHTISYLLGFRWGYEEFDDAGKRCVIVRQLKILDCGDWQKHLPLLRKDFGTWQFM